MIDFDLSENDVKRFWKFVHKKEDYECWEWVGCKCREYGKFILNKDFNNRAVGAHRISWIIHFGDIVGNQLVCHTCDNPPCVNPRHLYLGTQLSNMKDMKFKGRGKSANGENHWCHKLTELDVRRIRSLYQQGTTKAKLSQLYNVSAVAIRKIIQKKTWKHVEA